MTILRFVSAQPKTRIADKGVGAESRLVRIETSRQDCGLLDDRGGTNQEPNGYGIAPIARSMIEMQRTVLPSGC
jgi:hypothetical protein